VSYGGINALRVCHRRKSRHSNANIRHPLAGKCEILCEPPLAPQILQLAAGAVLPYKWHIAAISNLDAEEKSAFADILR
jgi:hypothetical protein